MSYDRIGRDDFWDIADLLPQKRARSAPKPTPTSTAPVEISAEAPSATGTVRDLPLTVEIHPERRATGAPIAPDEVYCPEASLVREVRIYRRKGSEHYFEAFARDARALCEAVGTQVPQVDFFSYMPQYSQLKKEQLAFYLWWRECFREGKPIDAPFSYLLLYLYEQINLGDFQDPRVGQENMLRLWLTYRQGHTRLEALVREWLLDYSLLYRLPPPTLSFDVYREALSGFRLKEFYIPSGEDCALLPQAVLAFCNNYDYTKSKFYTAESKSDFDRVLIGAVRVALEFLQEDGGMLAGKEGLSTMTREAFAGAVCTPRLKAKIEVAYTSFSATHELRYIITDVLKYAENALRAVLGVRSRLSIYAVSAPLRARLDAFLAVNLPQKKQRAMPKAEPPQYERRYDLPRRDISAARAAEIEAASWQTTRRLVEAFAPDTGAENATDADERDQQSTASLSVAEAASVTAEALSEGAENENIPQNGSDFAAALGKYRDFVVLAAARDREGQRSFARGIGELPDAIADKINTVAGDFVGDIILEDLGGCFGIVEDYVELLKEEGVL